MTPRSRPAGWAVLLAGVVAALVPLLAGCLVAPGTMPPTTSPSPVETSAASSAAPVDPESGLRWIEVSALPPEGRATIRLIEAGGPFPYAKDGVKFGNNERILPRRAFGYYREYTVPTPGSKTRGARRIVTGNDDTEFYYTPDHYATFLRIRR